MLNIIVKQHPEDGYYAINANFENNTAMNFQAILNPVSDQLTVPENPINTEGWNEVEFGNITDQLMGVIEGPSPKAEKSIVATLMNMSGQLSRAAKGN